MAKLIVGNWKMIGRKAEAITRCRALAMRAAEAEDNNEETVDVVVCPPFPLVDAVAATLSGSPILVGGQDCAAADDGPHTGDVSAGMLADFGCSHVLLGHSERRQTHGEIDLVVGEKAAAALRADMVAVICVGETERERRDGQALSVCARQVAGSLPQGAGGHNVVIAYEPVWAIGTGKTPTASEIAQAHQHIRAQLSRHMGDAEHVPILYGGSVRPDNAIEILSVPNVDGVLVGKASLSVDEFWAIIEAAR